MHDFLTFSPKICCLPVIHGSGDFSVEVRRLMLEERFDCVAVPLPPSFQSAVEQGLAHLPNITIATQEETSPYDAADWSPDDDDESPPPKRACSYVPIDPCQPVIAALRIAQQEHIPRAFVDCEVERFETSTLGLPDPYALKRVAIEKFSAAVLPALPRPRLQQVRQRVSWMARRLRELEKKYNRILFVCSVTEWVWVREAYTQQIPVEFSEEEVQETQLFRVAPETLLFLLGELPFITGLYERARSELDSDENLSIDGVKELLLSAREKYQQELKGRARRITPHLLATCLKYIRNLSLIERRLTPDFYTLVTSAKQMAGDQFAISLAETSREYPFQNWLPLGDFQVSVDRGQLPDGTMVEMKSRLPGNPIIWRQVQLNRKAPKIDQQQWRMRWNPFTHCSWPPEDVAIERFRTHVKDHALNILGNDLARTEKFSTSLKDGLDIRETLRNWHTGELYVKVIPPSRGSLDCVLMFFDSPADPRDYPWRITWHAEHQDESTLSFFASDYRQELVGPGIATATYGGAMFLFPPRPVRDVWHDARFDVAETLEERLLFAACHLSQERHIAVLSAMPPGQAWRKIAARHGKRLVHVPLAHFSQETVQQLRIFHVLNGHHVRSYAEHFIRKA